MIRMQSTKSKQGGRRSHHQVAKSAYTTDQDGENGAVRIRHRASRFSGMYRGRKVIDTSREERKIEKKVSQRQKDDGDVEKKTVEQVAAPK